MYLLKSSLLKHHKYFIISLFLAAECTFFTRSLFYTLQITDCSWTYMLCTPTAAIFKGPTQVKYRLLIFSIFQNIFGKCWIFKVNFDLSWTLCTNLKAVLPFFNRKTGPKIQGTSIPNCPVNFNSIVIKYFWNCAKNSALTY